jgi:ABC-type Fe3+-hydroxamate transport system substrate-binding protein
MAVRVIKNTVFAVFLVLLAGCSITSSDNRQIFVYVEEDRLVIQNESNREIFYLALGVSVLPFIDWYPFISPGEGLQPGTRDYIPIDDIPNVSGDEVKIFWWHDRGVSSTPRHSEIQSMILVIPQWKP